MISQCWKSDTPEFYTPKMIHISYQTKSDSSQSDICMNPWRWSSYTPFEIHPMPMRIINNQGRMAWLHQSKYVCVCGMVILVGNCCLYWEIFPSIRNGEENKYFIRFVFSSISKSRKCFWLKAFEVLTHFDFFLLFAFSFESMNGLNRKIKRHYSFL